MAVYEWVLDNGQVVLVDSSSLANYVNPDTGELEIDIVARDINDDMQAEQQKQPQTGMTAELQKQPQTGMTAELQKQPQTGMTAEQRAAFDAANDVLQQTGAFITPRGDNFGGAARNFAAGLLPFNEEIEAGVRSLFGTGTYEEYLQNARDSQRGFAEVHPDLATALQIGGGLTSALLPFGWASRAATIPGLMARGTALGAGSGALYGLGAGEGGFNNRLDTALTGALSGAVGGAVAPLAITGLGNAGRRVYLGLKRELPESQISNAILDFAVQPGTKGKKKAAYLRQASLAGAEDIENAAENLQLKIQTHSGLKRNPYVAELTKSPYWSEQTPSTERILSAVKSPAKTAAEESYANWAATTPERVPNAGLSVNKLLSEEPILNQAINKELKLNAPDWEGQPLSSREGLRRILEVLRDSSKKAPTDAISSKDRALNRGRAKLDNLAETLYPGFRQQRQIYRAGEVSQDIATKTALDRVRSIAQRPIEENPEVSLTGLARFAVKPYYRGRGRELILNNGELQNVAPWKLQLGDSTVDALIRSIINQDPFYGEE